MNSRKIEYAEYLKSDHWQALRWKVMCEQKSVCQVCGSGRINLHHVTYPRDFYGPEHTSEMIVILCFRCHRIAHKLLKSQVIRYGDPKDATVAAIKRHLGQRRKEVRRREFWAKEHRTPRRKKQYIPPQKKIPEKQRLEERERKGNFVTGADGSLIYSPKF